MNHKACSLAPPQASASQMFPVKPALQASARETLALVFNFFANPSWFSFFTLSSHINETPWSVFQDGLIWPILTDLFFTLPSPPEGAFSYQASSLCNRPMVRNGAKYQQYSRGMLLTFHVPHPFSSIVSRLPSVSHTPRFHQHPPLWLRCKCSKVCFLVLDQITSISTTSNSFDSLFRVLFIFPSQYLFAIGFPSLFSLRWSIPPILSCTLKQLDSFTPSCLCCPATRYTLRESHPLCCRFPSDLVYPSPSIRRGL